MKNCNLKSVLEYSTQLHYATKNPVHRRDAFFTAPCSPSVSVFTKTEPTVCCPVCWFKNGHLRSKTLAASALMLRILFSSDMASPVGKEDAQTEKKKMYRMDFDAYTLVYMYNMYLYRLTIEARVGGNRKTNL